MDIGGMSGFDGKRKNMSNWHVLSCSYGSCVSLKVLSKRCKIKSVNHESHGKTELDAAGFIRADENDKRAPA